MCVQKWFGGGSGAKLAAQMAEQQRQDAAASIAAANLDSESSRTAAESRMRKIAGLRGLASTVLDRGGGGGGGASAGLRMLTGI